MDAYTVQLDNETNMYCTLQLFTNVQNTEEVRKRVISGELSCCVLKASLVVDPLQVVVAANKAALNAKFSKLTTKTLYTELLFCLSLSKNISKSLMEFGITDRDKDILVVIVHEADEKKSRLAAIASSIKGETVAVSKLREFTDLELMKKTYRIESEELKVSSFTDSVISRISCKDFLSLK